VGYNVPAILQQMMFHHAAGGRRYAHLGNDYHQFVDLSGHIALGRAIVVGYSQRPDRAGSAARAGAVLLRDGQPLIPADSAGAPHQHWTCFRFVVPVEAAE
jgi:hypothetical protein